MENRDDFQELMRRVRAGDADAATTLVRRYEPAIRRAVRIWMLNGRRRAFDSMDVCQSVLASFFVRTALSQYHVESPDQLVKLLVSMARHKLADRVRRERAECRDSRRVEPGDVRDHDPVGGEPTPSRLLSAKDLLQEFRRRMTAEERHLADERAQGREWPQIAAELGARPDALRKKLDRALERIAAELGLDDFRHE